MWRTNRNLCLIDHSQLQHKPFLLKPIGKDYLWGGNRLNDDFKKNIDLKPLAETWECSTHPDGVSIVASGLYKGWLLSDVLQKHPEYLGTHPHTECELPILVKLIDAQYDLSIQVHPNDAYAMKEEGGQLGKSEMWYVIDAAKDAKLIYGLLRETDKDTIRKDIENGTVEKHLQRIPVKKDDVFFVEAGTIHAIGAGTLLAEIQQNSNLTYRLYDYNRTDRSGNKRELHIDKALEVANLKGSIEPRQPMRILRYRLGYASEMLCRCKYFEVHRILVNTESLRNLVSYRSDSTSFRVLLCVNGCGTVRYESDAQQETIEFFKGDTIFIPAYSVELKIHGKAQFLDIKC